MLIAQITDIHIGFDRGNPEEQNMQRLRAVVDRLVNGPNRPDLLLMSGDLTEFGDVDSYRRLCEAVADCPFPVLPMVGNHDVRENLLQAFPETPHDDGFIQYVLDLGEMRLIVLDTLEPGRHGGAFCEARAAWLDARLEEDRTRPVVIAMHHPPFESGLTWLDSSAHEPWIRRFGDVVVGQRQVKGIVAGHLHRTIHTTWQGLSLTVAKSTSPAVALDLRPIDPDTPDGRALITDELPGYALHLWDGRWLITHFESIGQNRVLAAYDGNLQGIVRLINDERGS